MTPLSPPTHTFRAMGSQITLWLEAEPDMATAAFTQAEALFAANEQALSRFLPDSDLSRLNGRSGQWTPVSDLLWSVLSEALAWAEATEGLFDPTLLDALENAGYGRSFETLPTLERNGRFSSSDGLPAPTGRRWTAVRLDAAAQSVWLPPGVRIDLGGIAKGVTAQQAADWLAQWGPCLVNAGGDLTAGAAPHGYPGWPVGLALPWTQERQTPQTAATLWLAQASLATSGIDYRRWRQNGRVAHHLIDPRTGQPAQTDAVTVTVRANRAAAAEAWATAALILGSADGYDVLSQHPLLAGAITTADERLLLTPTMRQLTGF